MGLTEEQYKQLREWGVNPKTIEPKPIKPLPTTTTSLPIQKKSNIRLLQIIIGIIIGIVIAFLIMSYYPQITTSGNELYLNGAAYGMDYAIALITKEAMECNAIPINYSNYSYTLVATECLQLNQGVHTQLNIINGGT